MMGRMTDTKHVNTWYDKNEIENCAFLNLDANIPKTWLPDLRERVKTTGVRNWLGSRGSNINKSGD